MPLLSENDVWVPVYKIAVTDRVRGGDPVIDPATHEVTGGGFANGPLKQLADRTRFLFNRIQGLGLGNGEQIRKGILPARVRNTVMAGPVGVDGSLAVITRPTTTSWRLNGSMGNPVILSFADGYNVVTGQPIDYLVPVTTTIDRTATSGIQNTVRWAIAVYNTGSGLLGIDETGTQPVYSYVQPTGASGLYWFDLSQQKMRVWNGTAFVDVLAVVLGEVVYGATPGQIQTVNAYPLGRTQGENDGIPTGSVLPLAFNPFFFPNSVPSGWLLANGAAVSRTVYRELFNLMGTTFGAGNGTTTFNLPDLRGEFIRGWDNGRGVDSGRVFGSAQADELREHTHRIAYAANILNSSSPTTAGVTDWEAGGAIQGVNNVQPVGGTETRPRNIALSYIIKY